jgi:hypothetical protein
MEVVYVYDGTEWNLLSFTKKRSGTPTGTAGGGIAQAQFKLQLHPSNGGVVITSYTATSNPGGITGTLSQSGSGSITVEGLMIQLTHLRFRLPMQ